MFRKLRFLAAIVLGLSLWGVAITAASGPVDDVGLPPTGRHLENATYTYNTVITVTSGTDPDTSKSKTCSSESACTLRRAIVESRGLAGGQLPVLIKFDIPQSPTEGYDSSLGVWKIEPLASSELSVFRRLKGQIIIDGETQPGGRSDGPKIILKGPATAKDGLIVGDTVADTMITIRGLAFQNFKTHLYVNTDDNLIEDCWFGLSDDGTTLSSGSDTDPEGGSAIAVASGAGGNTIRNNVFAGFTGVAAAIRGHDNQFSGNRVGTRADGTVPIPAQFSQHPCLSGAWTGGVGITVDGQDHSILDNLFAGLFLDVGPATTQSPAMDVTGSGHTIQNNIVGLDATGGLVGVCGRGLDFGGGPSAMQVVSNTIVESGLSAVLMNNWQCNGNTLRSNVIKRANAWPGEQGQNSFSENAIAYGPHVPDELRSFEPAQVTDINGTAVNGTDGVGSDCPNCTIELFLDDADAVTETLQSLVTVIADGSGNWSATLPAPLDSGQGLRTMSTVPDNFTIIGLDAGTTSNLSELQAVAYRVFLPLALRQP